MRFFLNIFFAFLLAIAPVISTAQVGMSSVATPTGAYDFARISTNATTVVKSGYGTLRAITINTSGATATATVYNNTAGSGTIIAVINSAANPQTLVYDIAFTTGLTIVTAGTTPGDLTISYK